MRVKILSAAVEDIHSGRLFYEKQGEGVGSYFVDSLFSDIDSLAIYAGIHFQVGRYHRMLSKRFPYAVYYRLEDGSAVVWRVLDLRRDPERISDALRNGQTIEETNTGTCSTPQ